MSIIYFLQRVIQLFRRLTQAPLKTYPTFRHPVIISWLSAIVLFFSPHLQAQNTIFLTEGRIEFEKKVNVYSQMEDDNSWSDLMKKTTPQFKSTFFNLVFKGNKTLYKPGRENPDNNKSNFWNQPVAEENIVYSDLDIASSVSQKKVFEQIYLVQDSIRRIKWKITSEMKNIAGFNCRRANAVIMDSIYVVAFYTDEIVTSGGPESFTNLPGMILGIALPHQHITWFATKVQAVKVTDAEITPPVKGKKVNNAAVKQSLDESFKDWGKNGRRFLVAVML
jgi:GLPGLI family protein